jgi:transposase-like protein
MRVKQKCEEAAGKWKNLMVSLEVRKTRDIVIICSERIMNGLQGECSATLIAYHGTCPYL